MNSNTMSFAEKDLEKRRAESNKESYMDSRFILPTLNVVERRASLSGRAFGHHIVVDLTNWP